MQITSNGIMESFNSYLKQDRISNSHRPNFLIINEIHSFNPHDESEVEEIRVRLREIEINRINNSLSELKGTYGLSNEELNLIIMRMEHVLTEPRVVNVPGRYSEFVTNDLQKIIANFEAKISELHNDETLTAEEREFLIEMWELGFKRAVHNYNLTKQGEAGTFRFGMSRERAEKHVNHAKDFVEAVTNSLDVLSSNARVRELLLKGIANVIDRAISMAGASFEWYARRDMGMSHSGALAAGRDFVESFRLD